MSIFRALDRSKTGSESPLTLYVLLGAFILWAAGVVMTPVVFALELLSRPVKHK